MTEEKKKEKPEKIEDKDLDEASGGLTAARIASQNNLKQISLGATPSEADGSV